MKPTKTAGTTVYWEFLKKEFDDLIQLDEKPAEFNSWLQSLNDDVLKEYFIFTVVRNPYDRFVSSAAYLKIPFEDLVFNFDKYIDDDNNYRHTLPQHYYTQNKGVRFVDFIVRFETLGSDMNLVCDYLGLKRRVLPIANKTSRTTYQNYYNESTKSEMEKRYSLDFKLYGYNFEVSKELHDMSFSGRVKRKLNKWLGTKN